MLQITIKKTELWDSRKQEFVEIDRDYTINLEHSLISLSKWESIWKKPFLNNDNKTREEFISYIKCMTLTQNIPSIIYNAIDNDTINQVMKYIEDPMTATWFGQNNAPPSRKVLTSEVIYYWMVASKIPFNPCEKWHLNRLLTLIRVCSEYNNPKKIKGADAAKSNAALNKARRAKLHSNG